MNWMRIAADIGCSAGRFGIDGVRVGDVDLRTSLRDFLFSIERLRCERGRRCSPRFATTPTKEIVDTLDSVLFGAGDPTYDAIADDEQWARYVLKPDVDVFDRWKIYLIETADKARLIYKYGDDVARERVLRPGECDTVLDEACENIGALLDSD